MLNQKAVHIKDSDAQFVLIESVGCVQLLQHHFVPDDKLSFILNYIKSFTPAKKTSSKKNHEKKAAYQSLLADAQPIQGKTLSLNGQDEVADIILDFFCKREGFFEEADIIFQHCFSDIVVDQ